MATWNARDWLAGLIGCSADELTIRSTDHYGAQETQVRYDRAGEVVARIVVTGPVLPMGVPAGKGHWAVSATIGSGMGDVHPLELPETDEISY